MADLSKKEWEHYERPEQSHVFKQIATVMRKGISPEEVAEFYSKWAGDLEYEKELPADVYNAPIVTAEAAADGLTEVQRAEARVLDVAAGTGMSGDRLRAHGFRHVDALDPSEGMLAKARERELAGLGEGHIKCCALTEMIRLVKPGGVIVIVTRFQHLESVEEYRGRLEPLMDQFEKEGRWRRMERRVFPGFFLDKEGILWKYQVC
ncbi:MET27-like protein [Mya arenaria]|uniref:MET27-like protein n=1 Tax=Mya arenaria TaxID=6604 RepID=A0ABY7ENY4_MYAAR|nr:MET27-like protein [Mya arenaria]